MVRSIWSRLTKPWNQTPRRSAPRRSFRPGCEALEGRCLMAADPHMPDPTTSKVADVFFVGDKIYNGQNVPAPPVKTITIQNNTGQTIFPILRDANTGMKDGIFYDPMDGHKQEFRGYIGYGTREGNFLGLQAHTSITIEVPLVFWDGANLYVATDGSDLIPASATAPNPFAYSATSTRAVVGSPYVVSSTNNNGLVMWYHDLVALTPTPDAPAQLTEFTIRDPYLTKYFSVPPDQGNVTLINYDVSYVDSLNLPLAMQATQVPIPNTSQKADYGWIGATLDHATMQQRIYDFIVNAGDELGAYFDGKGWAYYYNPDLATAGYKIPSGANVFANSPLNDTRSKYDNDTWALSSGGLGKAFAHGGGVYEGTTTLRVDFLTAEARDAFFAILQSWKDHNEEFHAKVADNTELGKVVDFAKSKFGDLFGVTVTLLTPFSLSGGGSWIFYRPVEDYVSTRIRDVWYAWADYYVKTFTGSQVTIGGDVTSTTANFVTLKVDPKGKVALGMRVSDQGQGIIRPGTTVLGIDKQDPKKIYLSQLPSGTGSGNFTFDPPTAMPYANEATPLNLTFAAGAETDKAKKFAASVYEAMIAEAAIPIPLPPDPDPHPEPKLPKSMVLVSTVIGADILHLPNHNDFLGGQVRDLIKSVLRGVPDFADPQYPESQWYPDPSTKDVGGQPFNVYNLDPYVWFVHKKLGLSGYGFSVDDDTADVGANGTSSLLIVVSGKNGLKNTKEWFPSVPWGEITTQAKVILQNGVAILQLQDATKYQQIRPDDPKNGVTGAYVWGQGIPAGTNLKDFGLLNKLEFKLSTNKVTPSSGFINVTFTGKNIRPALTQPMLGGAVAAQAVGDNQTINPFAAFTVSDANPDEIQTLTVTQNHWYNGTFTAQSPADAGFAALGDYRFAFTGTAAEAQAAIRQLVFDPAENRVAPGQTFRSSFTVTADDGTDTVRNTGAWLVITSVNDAPVLGGAKAGQAINDNQTVRPFGSFTIADADSPAQRLTVDVKLSHAANGKFTLASLAASGFVSRGNGLYQFTGTAAQAQAAIRKLVYNPTDNQVAPGKKVKNYLRVYVKDGVTTTSDLTTFVEALSV